MSADYGIAQMGRCSLRAIRCSMCADYTHNQEGRFVEEFLFPENNDTGLKKRSPALFFVKAKIYGRLNHSQKYERLRYLRITRSRICHLWY